MIFIMMNSKKTFLLLIVTAVTFSIQAVWLPCAITKSLVRMAIPDFRTNRPYLQAVVLPAPSFREDLRQSWRDIRNGNTLLYGLHSMHSLQQEEEAASPQELAEFREDLRQIQERMTQIVTDARRRQAERIRINSADPSRQINIDRPELQALRITSIMEPIINSGSCAQDELANVRATVIWLDAEAARQRLLNNRE